MKDNVYFVSGIDTDIGKTFATGIIARMWNDKGINTITQKLVQTGSAGISEDILTHRRLMGMPLNDDDESRATMPEIFSHASSPHLASKLEGRAVNFDKIRSATELLSEKYEAVLVEGAGGLMVPLTADYLAIDYISDNDYPVIFVTSGRLGSINHTLLSLEALSNRGIRLDMLVFNSFPKLNDTTISDDTEWYFKEHIRTHFPEADFLKI